MDVDVLIADDHLIVRRGVRALLSSNADYRIIGEASNGREAAEAARKLNPTVVLIDPAMPGLNGADVTAQIRAELPETVVLALSMHSDERYVSRMLAAGAGGYLLKTCNAEELFHAIEVAMEGGMYLTPEVAGVVVDNYVNGRGAESGEDRKLSAREREVLQLLAKGKTAKGIGHLLHVSSRTIDSHRQRIMAKLKVDSVAELTKCAIRMGLTTAEC